MTDFTLDDYSLLNEDQIAQTTSKYPIYIHNTILKEFVFWSVEHIRNNSTNTITNSYNENKKSAQGKRLKKVLDKIKHKIETSRLITDQKPTIFPIYLSEFTTEGNRSQEVFCEFLSLTINNIETTLYILSPLQLTDHAHRM